LADRFSDGLEVVEWGKKGFFGDRAFLDPCTGDTFGWWSNLLNSGLFWQKERIRFVTGRRKSRITDHFIAISEYQDFKERKA